MKRTISVLSVLLIITSLVLSGCSILSFLNTGNDEDSTAAVYYIDKNNSGLVAEKIKLPDTSKRSQLKFLLEKLISPDGIKISPLSSETEIESIDIHDEIAIVDFSNVFYDNDELKQALAPIAIAKTLCSTNYITGVKILVEGEDVLGADGKPLGIIYESDLVLSENDPYGTQETSIVLYFADDMAEYLIPERRNVQIADSSTVEKAVVTELIGGPKESGHNKTIPQETKLLSVETKNNVCFVNLSKDFVDKHSGGTAAELLTVYSIVNSLTELDTVDSVQFLIEGEKREEFIHMSFNEPIVRNKSIIKQ